MRENASNAAKVLRSKAASERSWLTVSGPVDFEEGAEIVRVAADIRSADADFLERLANYRNLLADAQGKKMRRRWTRKSLMESFVAIQCDSMRANLEEMLKACGELPPVGEDRASQEAARKYVDKVLAWDKRNSK